MHPNDANPAGRDQPGDDRREHGRDVEYPVTKDGESPAEPLDIDAEDVEKALPGGGSHEPDSPAEDASAQPPG